MKTLQARKAQARATILSILQDAGRPMSAQEIAQHPKARRLNPRNVAQLLIREDGAHRVGKRWEAKAKQHVITVIPESKRVARVVAQPGDACIAYSRSRNQLLLVVGAAEFPFTIID